MKKFILLLIPALLMLAGCEKNDPAALPTLSVRGTLHTDEPLNTLALRAVPAINGETIEGVFTWKDGTITYGPGEYDAEWVFTPSDAGKYPTKEGSVMVTVLPNVYTCEGSGINTIAVWKNETNLYRFPGFPISITASGGDIYTGGRVDDVATVWKNGSKLYTLSNEPLPGGIFSYSEVVSLAVSGNDIYSCVKEPNDIVKVWKNDQLLYTMNKLAPAALAVSGNDVYVCGMATSDLTAAVWMNGQELYKLSKASADWSWARSLVICGADVYTCGSEYHMGGAKAKAWKNDGVLYSLTDGTQGADAYSLAVSGSDVYICGYENNGAHDVAKVWKNGKALYSLSDGKQDANAARVMFSNNSLYTCSFQSHTQTVWKNDKKIHFQSQATSMDGLWETTFLQ